MLMLIVKVVYVDLVISKNVSHDDLISHYFQKQSMSMSSNGIGKFGTIYYVNEIY